MHPSSIMRFCVLPSTISAILAIAATAWICRSLSPLSHRWASAGSTPLRAMATFVASKRHIALSESMKLRGSDRACTRSWLASRVVCVSVRRAQRGEHTDFQKAVTGRDVEASRKSKITERHASTSIPLRRLTRALTAEYDALRVSQRALCLVLYAVLGDGT